MSESRTYRVVIRDHKSDTKDPFRVYFNISILAQYGLDPGSACLLTDQEGRHFMATAWYPEKQLDGSVVEISRIFQEMHDLKQPSRLTVQKMDSDILTAHSISIHEVASLNKESELLVNGDTKDISSVIESLKRTLRFQKSPHVAIGMTLESKLGASKRTFRIAKATPAFPYRAIYRVGADTNIELKAESDADADSESAGLVLCSGSIGGLAVQLEQLQELLDVYSRPHTKDSDDLSLLCLEGGVLLYGRSGTGKSLLVNAISGAAWQRVFHLRKDALVGNAAGLREAVDMALKLEPSLIVLDPLDDLIAGRSSDVLVDAFEQTARSRVLILGATSDIRDLPERYRQQNLFEYQINIPVPDSKARAEILKVLCRTPKKAESELLTSIAARTHGFVGSDLRRLFHKTLFRAMKRGRLEQSAAPNGESDGGESMAQSLSMVTISDLTPADWEDALADTRPSAMNDVILETPETRWSDIGGYHRIKKELRFTIGLQIRYGTDWAAFHLEPTRGILLYGPPGCSKTMIAKAVATEMGFNFLAIKGAEVLDKYVGESERKIREIFDTARAASPSIIFFDEIDAIGAHRGSTDGGVQGGLHMLTTMLNEMDGIEARRDVFILAATNRPDVLDPALMRPGRLDRHILVDLPDGEARREILESKLKDSPYPVEASLIEWLTEATHGYSGAEVVHVIKEAVSFVIEEHEENGTELVIGQQCFEHALDRVEPRVTEEMVEKLRAWGKRASR